MKLTLKELQSLDILLNNLSIKENLQSRFNIVIKIDNQLWQGNFVYFENNITNNYYDDAIKEFFIDKEIGFNSRRLFDCNFFLTNKDFSYEKYVSIYNNVDETYSNAFILKEFVKVIKKSALQDFEPYRILYNAVNLTTNTKLPFINLSSDEYEVVSLIRN
ncbi:hypothetical protein UMC2_26291 [[Clostridium] sordellii]|uniref:hypothetical protein n=1 Tax=Paraclostridium sordellii TaxID=1505 RepID=UPI000543D7CD|nr:hypothetical protein [Paeniclostridium sordellii]CEK35736.1 hypothetical protein UMC2_26291 [[Clostridium] sordellii] [Paeniclostridium sordellii]